MRSIYLIVFFMLTACGHAQPTEVEMTPKQETKYKVPKGKKVLAVLRCIGECKSPLDTVLKSTGRFHSNAVPAEKAQVLEKKAEVPKGKKSIAVLGCDKPLHLCPGMEDFDSDAFAMELNKRQMKSLADNPNIRPYGEVFPVATPDGCDNLADWDQKNILSKRVVDSMRMMLKDKNTDCAWSKRYLQCGGVLVAVGAYNNYRELKIAQVKNIYRVCQE
jgi:hypothetical protein